MENVLGKYIENKFGCQRMLLGNIWKISLNVAKEFIQQKILRDKYCRIIHGKQMYMLWNITKEYMENKSRCWGLLLKNTLNINYGMENIVGEYIYGKQV